MYCIAFSLKCCFLLSGGLGNRAALTLYLLYGFEIAGMYEDVVLLVLKDLDNGTVDRAIRIVTQRTEGLYLLPVLKERHLQLASEASQVSGVSASAVENPSSQSTNPSVSSPAREESCQVL